MPPPRILVYWYRSVEEVLIVLGCEIILCTGLAAERSAIGNLLKVVQTAGDATIAVHIVGIQVDGGATFHAGIHLGAIDDGIAVSIHNAGSSAGVGVDEVAVLVGFVIRALSTRRTQSRCLRSIPEVCKSLVGLCHLVNVFLLLEGRTC